MAKRRKVRSRLKAVIKRLGAAAGRGKYEGIPKTRIKAYKRLVKKVSKSYARNIAIDGETFEGRSRMARKAARTRRRNRRVTRRD